MRVGRLDGRFTGPDPNGLLDTPFYDPSGRNPPPFTSTFNNYVRSELGYKTDMPYYVSAQQAGFEKWDWGSSIKGFPDTATALREAMVKNPYLKVFVMEGYYDLATPYCCCKLHHGSSGHWPKVSPEHLIRDLRSGTHGVSADGGLKKMKSDEVRFMEMSGAQ